jgi:hypothetical protein
VVERVLRGEELERPEGCAILNCADERLAELLAATLRVRETAFGRRVKVCILRNAQSGVRSRTGTRRLGARATPIRPGSLSCPCLRERRRAVKRRFNAERARSALGISTAFYQFKSVTLFTERVHNLAEADAAPYDPRVRFPSGSKPTWAVSSYYPRCRICLAA